jgi:hypothetical protein
MNKIEKWFKMFAAGSKTVHIFNNKRESQEILDEVTSMTYDELEEYYKKINDTSVGQWMIIVFLAVFIALGSIFLGTGHDIIGVTLCLIPGTVIICINLFYKK